MSSCFSVYTLLYDSETLHDEDITVHSNLVLASDSLILLLFKAAPVMVACNADVLHTDS